MWTRVAPESATAPNFWCNPFICAVYGLPICTSRVLIFMHCDGGVLPFGSIRSGGSLHVSIKWRSRLPSLARLRANSPGLAESRLKTCKRSEEHTSELQSQSNLVCRLLLGKKKKRRHTRYSSLD